nr:hypothetical protein [uncultured Capnocytophaga sp.]
MKLTGIIDRSLGQICLRGFAPIKELARISIADYTYQRNLLDKQQARISNFLDNEQFLFFPEVILCFRIKSNIEQKRQMNSLQSIELGKNIITQDGKISIKFIKNKTELKLAELNIDDTFLNNLISNGDYLFHRIDGNHRLSASEETESSFVNNLKIPYCIIIGEDFYENGKKMEEHSKEFDKAVQVYFHNINTKVIPLTSEENLKGIVNNKDRFSDEELSKIINTDGTFLRNLLTEVKDYNAYPNLKNIIRDYEKTFSVILTNLLKDKINISDTELIRNILSESNTLLSKFSLRYNCEILLALIYFLFTKKNGERFLNWAKINRLDAIDDISAENIINLYEESSKREINVFVAMPYFSKNIVESHNKIYNGAIEKIKNDYDININLYEIMTYEGASVNIINDIFEKIKNCQIFIANITNNNPNVTYEMGWARALNVPIIIVKEKDSEPKSDYKLDSYFEYQKEAYTTLKDGISKHLKNILKDIYKFAITE